MAAPGLGIGDLVNACSFIYDMCVKYKDAPKEFDEIAEKAKSTAVVLERIDAEAKISGNLVERTGPQGYGQLQDHLAALRKDSEKLKALVTKYYTIHDEGPGRRLLFTFKESNGLTDLRRRIGLHEQMLQIWYMTLVYGSLRRLEGGQEGILRAIEAIKNWSPQKKHAVKRSLDKGDSRPLEHELRSCGLEPEAVEAAIETAVDYMEAPPVEQVKMESRARSSLNHTTRAKADSKMSPDGHGYGSSAKPHFVFNGPSGLTAMPDLRRSTSASARRPRPSLDPDEEPGARSRRHKEDVYELNGLVIPDTRPRHRSASSHGAENRVERPKPDAGRYAEQVIVIQEPPRLHRSSSQRSDRSNKKRRDSSTHSYTRRRSSSRGGQEGEERVEWVRIVNKMDRIDSIPI